MRHPFLVLVLSGVVVLALWVVGRSACAQPPGGYPAMVPCLPADEQAKLVAAFQEKNAGKYLGIPSGFHPAIDVALALPAAEEKELAASLAQAGPGKAAFALWLARANEKGVAWRNDAPALQAAGEFLKQNRESFGLDPDDVELRACNLPGLGSVIGLTFKGKAAAEPRYFTLGLLRNRRFALDGVVQVAGEPAAVRLAQVFTRPLPAAVKLPAAKLTADQAKQKAAGAHVEVLQAGTDGATTGKLTLAAGQLGEVREVFFCGIQEEWAPAMGMFLRNYQIDVRAEPKDGARVAWQCYVDSISGVPTSSTTYVPESKEK